MFRDADICRYFETIFADSSWFLPTFPDICRYSRCRYSRYFREADIPRWRWIAVAIQAINIRCRSSRFLHHGDIARWRYCENMISAMAMSTIRHIWESDFHDDDESRPFISTMAMPTPLIFPGLIFPAMRCLDFSHDADVHDILRYLQGLEYSRLDAIFHYMFYFWSSRQISTGKSGKQTTRRPATCSPFSWSFFAWRSKIKHIV